eukprot:640260-Alexandrium_andersonii.AAC.1
MQKQVLCKRKRSSSALKSPAPCPPQPHVVSRRCLLEAIPTSIPPPLQTVHAAQQQGLRKRKRVRGRGTLPAASPRSRAR